MASQIILKKSSVESKVPLDSDLVFGELAINYQDGALYYKRADNSIQNLIPSSVVSSFNGRSGAVTLNSSDIKTVNSTSLLGSGDLQLFSGGLVKVEVVSSLPGSPDANTLYIVTG
jgi:hypothetical protein